MESNFFNSDEFKSQLVLAGHSPIARLNALCSTLYQWNQTRHSSIGSPVANLSISDINLLKDVINTEISRLKLKNAEIVTDQILFMLIGAMNLQSKNSSAKLWALVNQSISSFTGAEKSRSRSTLTLVLATLIITFGITTKNDSLHNDIAPANAFDTAHVASINTLGNSTVNNLVSMYNKMKEGSCQLPQAAMLQPQDREAFIAFINQGKVEIGTADNLKSALAYVHCLYPQKLMDKPLQISNISS